MKPTVFLNSIALGIPITLGLIGLIDKEYSFYAITSIIITGILQVLIALVMFYKNPKNKYIQFYLVIVILYFTNHLFNINFLSLEISEISRVIVPPFLAIYLTIIIHKTKE